MTIARTRVWAVAVVASFTATRSFSIGLAMCATLAILPASVRGSGLAAARLAGASDDVCPVGWMADRRRSRVGKFQKRFWQQHQPARRLHLAKYDRGIRIRAVDLDSAVIEHHERARVRRVCRLQHAMGSTRPRGRSRIQIRKHCDRCERFGLAAVHNVKPAPRDGEHRRTGPDKAGGLSDLARAPAMPGAISCLMRWSESLRAA